MTWCECCRREIPGPVIHTIAGDFVTGWGLCRRCWRMVTKVMRRAVVWARVAFRAEPHLEQSIALYWLWQLAVAEALFVSGRRAAA